MKNFKKVQKIAALSLAGLLGCSSLVACGGGGGGNSSSSASKGTTTTLKIKVFNGGLGYAWLQELANNFMDTFKDVSFEKGKKGVSIEFTADKEFSSLHTKMATGADAHDIYYTSDCNFYNFMNESVAYDVTDIMTADVYNADGEVQLNAAKDGWKKQSKSIADRITVEHTATRLNVGTKAKPQYYALPFDDSTAGIIVDWDLFVANGWNNGSGIDGMPGTMQEFYDLLDTIRAADCSAFIYGTGVQYSRVIQDAVIAQVDGSETYYDLFSDYTGEYDFNGDGTIADDEKITPATAYKIMDTKGYKAAVEMATKMFSKNEAGKAYYDQAVANGVEFGVAQMNFVSSIMSNMPIAMIIEGEWWENEARATFNSMGDIMPEYAYGEREFRMMPIPTFDSTNEDQKYTLGSWTGGACTIVNEKTVGKNEALQKLVEVWLQYQYSSEGLKCFSRHSGSTLPFNYEMTDAEMQELTPFARNMFALRRDSRVEVIYNGVSIQTTEIRNGAAQLNFATEVSTGRYGGNTLFNLMLKMSKAGKMVSVEEYVAGLHTFQDENIIGAYTED